MRRRRHRLDDRGKSAALARAIAVIVCWSVGARAGDGPARAPARDVRRTARTEFTPLPIVGGTTDSGFGGGVMASLARLGPRHVPYLYRLEVVSLFLLRTEGGVSLGYQDHYALLSLPRVAQGRLKLEIRGSYTRENEIDYYGIGNAAPIEPGHTVGDRRYAYDRIHPTLRAQGIVRLHRPISSLLGVSYTHDVLDVPSGSKLLEDAERGSPVVRSMITTFEPHGVFTFRYGLELDTRDDAVSPARGQRHTAFVDYSPGGTPALPHRWGRFNTTFRAYFPIRAPGTSLALRAVADLLFGTPPFYELARQAETAALGGPNGVRGVPGHRYHGMVKVLGNVELRTRLFSFDWLDKNNAFGLAAFLDAGRLWARYSPHPELDGHGLGLKTGIGGGPRLHAGTSFVVRGDVAWSPSEHTLGAYLAAGHAY